jgi:predicted ABC-type ATPase
MKKRNTPQLWFIGGPNGAGKSTLAERYSLEQRLPLVNPDNIAKELSTSCPATEDVRLRAGREAIKRQNNLLAEKKSFVIESTLSGKRELNLLRTAKEAGYKVNLVFCGVDSPVRSLSRVRLRVDSGGHEVPPVDIMRRYPRSMENLSEALTLADRAFIFDNSKGRHQLILSLKEGQMKFYTKICPNWLLQACPKLGKVE